jgi:hypothetical protein
MVETSQSSFTSLHPSNFKDARYGRLAVAGVVVLVAAFAHGAWADDPPCSMTPGELFGQFLPYDGLAALWIRPDGLIIIEGGNDKGAAFSANAAGLKLVEQNEKVTFKTAAEGGTVLHTFVDVGTQGCATCQAAYYIPGDATLFYDEETCRLSISIDGARQDFEAVVDFGEAQPAQPNDDDDPTIISCGVCQAVPPQTCCYAPPGCCKTCPANQDCMCWTHGSDPQQCKCTHHCYAATTRDAAIPAEIQP